MPSEFDFRRLFVSTFNTLILAVVAVAFLAFVAIDSCRQLDKANSELADCRTSIKLMNRAIDELIDENVRLRNPEWAKRHPKVRSAAK